MSGPIADGIRDDLVAIAFHKEKTQAKRIATRTGVTLQDALQQVLTAVALPRSIPELVADRLHEISRQAARRSLRRQRQVDARQRKQDIPFRSPTQWQGWFDGSASPNPGHICAGAVLLSPQGVFTDISRSDGIGDSSEAEYLALIAVLEMAVTQQVTMLCVFGDSRIVLDDVMGVHLVATLADHRRQAQQLQRCIGEVIFCWIPRAKNSRADCLASRWRR